MEKYITLKMTYFSLLNCQEREAHVIPQMTTLKQFQLSLRHAHDVMRHELFLTVGTICFSVFVLLFARFFSGFYFSYDTRVMSNVIV